MQPGDHVLQIFADSTVLKKIWSFSLYLDPNLDFSQDYQVQNIGLYSIQCRRSYNIKSSFCNYAYGLR